MAELKPTYGNFTLRGEVVWKDRKSFDENTGASGYLYRKIRFGVKTEEDNIVEVELFQTKFDTVKLQNAETKKLDKDVKYGDHTGDLPEGYQLFMPIYVGLKQDDEGNNIKEKLIPFDAIKYIDENLENGQSVFMFGSPRFSQYEKDGNLINQVKFEPKGIFGSTSSYGDEDFISQSTFDQEMIITETKKDGDTLFVNAYIVTDKDGNFVPHSFYIDIKKNQKFAMNVKRLKFGTIVKAEGIIHHTVETQKVEVEDDPWGESPEPKVATKVKKSMEITKIEKPEKDDIGKFKPEDFVKKEKDEDKNNPFLDGDSDDNNDDNDWDDVLGESENSEDDPFKDM